MRAASTVMCTTLRLAFSQACPVAVSCSLTLGVHATVDGGLLSAEGAGWVWEGGGVFRGMGAVWPPFSITRLGVSHGLSSCVSSARGCYAPSCLRPGRCLILAGSYYCRCDLFLSEWLSVHGLLSPRDAYVSVSDAERMGWCTPSALPLQPSGCGNILSRIASTLGPIPGA